MTSITNAGAALEGGAVGAEEGLATEVAVPSLSRQPLLDATKREPGAHATEVTAKTPEPPTHRIRSHPDKQKSKWNQQASRL